MRIDKLRSFLPALAASLAAILLLTAACGGDDDSEESPNLDEPSIRGVITTKSDATNGGEVLGSLRVEGEVEPDTQYNRASVRVDEDTDIYSLFDGEPVRAGYSDLRQGQTVEVWFDGPVAESDPVQAKAGRILILSD
ncbi:MAG: DUF3221 domain-containing protein [Dehalococcoidia bacterium]